MFKKEELSNLKPGNWVFGAFWVFFTWLILFSVVKWRTVNIILWVPVWLIFFGTFLRTRRVECLLYSLGIVLFNVLGGWPAISGNRVAEVLFYVCGFILAFTYIIWKQWQFPGSDLPFRYFRDILELAAKPVVGISDGYTGRPYPAGKARYSKEEILDFSKFLHKHFIATAYTDDNGVKLVFSNGFFQYIPFWKPNWQKVTYMTFDFNGNFSVFIAKKHYREYALELTFDQLCNSFGDVIAGLLEDYKKGKTHKILSKVRGREILSQKELEMRGSNLSGWLSDIREKRLRKKGLVK